MFLLRRLQARSCLNWRPSLSLLATNQSGLSLLSSTTATRAFSEHTGEEILPVVAIVGRPNVGKSALYNRLVRRKEALVYNTPGSHVTRDYREGSAQLSDLRFTAVDTSGLEPSEAEAAYSGPEGGSIQRRTAELTRHLLRRTDLVLLVLDARDGVLPADQEVLHWLRRSISDADAAIRSSRGSSSSSSSSSSSTSSSSSSLTSSLTANGPPRAPSLALGGLSGSSSASAPEVLLVLNKCESRGGGSGRLQVQDATAEATRLGLGEPVAVSAETGEGMVELYEALRPRVDAATAALRSALLASSPAPPTTSAEAAAAAAEAVDAIAITRGGGRREGDVGGEVERQWQVAMAAAGSGTPLAGDIPNAAELSAAAMAAGCEVLLSPGGDDVEEGVLTGGKAGGRMNRVSMAIMGLPNVGKSTLTNRLLGQERCITGPEPGLTRDPVKAVFEHQGRAIELADTPGWIKRSAAEQFDEVGGAVASASQGAGVRALNLAQVVVLMVDAERMAREGQALTRREMGLAATVAEEGRGLVLAVNKVDAMATGVTMEKYGDGNTKYTQHQPLQRSDVIRAIADDLHRHLPQIANVPCVPMSATSGRGVPRLLPAVLAVWTSWNARVPTSAINKWLAHAAEHYHGTITGKALGRVRYMTQVGTRPPSFAAFLSGSQPVDPSFQRFLANALQQRFEFVGTPLRFVFRYKQKRKDMLKDKAAGVAKGSGGGAWRQAGRRRPQERRVRRGDGLQRSSQSADSR